MSNKQTIIDNNARIDALTKRLNNSTLADVRDTTATAGDVASGKIFYDKDGVRTEGSGTISSGKDMLQARVDSNNSCYRLMMAYNGNNVDFLENLDTSKVTNMEDMFSGCSNITTIPQLDTSSCTNMAAMFNNCSTLTTIPQIDTSSCTIMTSMFKYCSKLTTIPQIDTSKVTNMSDMFNGCSNLTTVNNLDMVKMTNSNSTNLMFYNCTNLTNLTLKNIKVKLQIGNSTTWGTLLTDESLINTAKELWDLTGSSSKTLTLSTPSNARLDAIYVKLVDVTDEMVAQDQYISNKKPCVVCESTDEGAMTLREYIISKNWSIA